MASEEMSFENLDRRWTMMDGQWMPGYTTSLQLRRAKKLNLL